MTIVTLDREDNAFDAKRLVDWLLDTGRHAMVIGSERATLDRHRDPLSLDYWIRAEVADDVDAVQATAAVVARLCATGLFEEAPVSDPFTGVRCPGIALRRAAELREAV